jgi:hypothetical protein
MPPKKKSKASQKNALVSAFAKLNEATVKQYPRTKGGVMSLPFTLPASLLPVAPAPVVAAVRAERKRGRPVIAPSSRSASESKEIRRQKNARHNKIAKERKKIWGQNAKTLLRGCNPVLKKHRDKCRGIQARVKCAKKTCTLTGGLWRTRKGLKYCVTK